MKTNLNKLKFLREYLSEVDKNWNYITSPELKKNIKNYFLLDVRKPSDYKKKYIKGSVNIFWKNILKKKNLDKIPKNKKIVIICYVGHTASQVLVILRTLGYDVKVLKFGMGMSPVKGIPVAGWTNYGYETESE